MSRLQCRLCGGVLVMNESWDFAECEQCGMKYSKDGIQKMLLDFQAADSQDTAAGTLLMKAGQQMDSGNYTGAKNTYQKILDTVDPLSTDAWWGLLQCRFRFAELLLSKQLGASEITFLFDGKPAWDMSAFDDNLKNAMLHASPEQKEAYEREYAAFMEALPEKRRQYEANRSREQLERDIANLQLELGRLQSLQAERAASLKDIKRKKRNRNLWLVPAVLSTLAVLYITYMLLTNTRSFNMLLFEFIVLLFIMTVFWMIFKFYKSGDLKKSRIAYLTGEAQALAKQADDAKARLHELSEQRDRLR